MVRWMLDFGQVQECPDDIEVQERFVILPFLAEAFRLGFGVRHAKCARQDQGNFALAGPVRIVSLPLAGRACIVHTAAVRQARFSPWKNR